MILKGQKLKDLILCLVNWACYHVGHFQLHSKLSKMNGQCFVTLWKYSYLNGKVCLINSSSKYEIVCSWYIFQGIRNYCISQLTMILKGKKLKDLILRFFNWACHRIGHLQLRSKLSKKNGQCFVTLWKYSYLHGKVGLFNWSSIYETIY